MKTQLLSRRFEYRIDNAYIKLSDRQKKKIAEFENTRGDIKALSCVICNNESFTVVSNIERHGLFFPTGICTRCGNIQQVQYYTANDLKLFYSQYYRDIYNPLGVQSEYLIQEQRGEDIIKFLPTGVLGRVNTILEIGTGAGGILKKFMDIGKRVHGLDYGTEYIEFGVSKSIPLKVGGLESLEEGQKFDLIILSHILEHIVEPREFLDKLKPYLTDEGFLYIEVPSIERTNRLIGKYDLRTYWENAHVVHFTIKTLKQLLEHSGYRYIKHDPLIRSVFKFDGKADQSLSNYYDENFRLLKEIESKYR